MSRKRNHDEFLESMRSLLDTGKYSDLTITCRDDTYSVHKSIVCSQSSFFEAACRFPGKEAAEGKISLPDDDPLIVKYMLQYMYGHEYLVPSESGPPRTKIKIRNWNSPKIPEDFSTNRKRELNRYLSRLSDRGSSAAMNAVHNVLPWTRMDLNLCGPDEPGTSFLDLNEPSYVTIAVLLESYITKSKPLLECPKWPQHYTDTYDHARLYVIADKYDVKGLKAAAAEKFEEGIKDMDLGSALFKTAEFVYSSTPDGDWRLRDAVVRQFSELFDDFGMPDRADNFLSRLPELAHGILQVKYNKGAANRHNSGRKNTKV